MHKSTNGFFNFILFLFVFGTLAMAEPQNDSIPLTAQEVHPLAVGDSAPDGTLLTIKGKEVKFQETYCEKTKRRYFLPGRLVPFLQSANGAIGKNRT